MDFLELLVEPDDVDLASGLLWGAGVAGIEERPHDDGRIALIVAVESEHRDAAVDAVIDRWPVRRREVDAEQYVDAWKPFARAARVASDIVIEPPWLASISTPEDLVVSLDPGLAWGHGSHPSTRLVAEELASRRPLVGKSMLDVGCGSGVLSILGALLGLHEVVAIDIEPQAVEATLANAVVNGVEAHIDVSTTAVSQVPGTFDIIVANIGARTLVELAPRLVERLSGEGVLVLSGLLEEQVDEVVAAYDALDERVRRLDAGWAAVCLQRPVDL